MTCRKLLKSWAAPAAICRREPLGFGLVLERHLFERQKCAGGGPIRVYPTAYRPAKVAQPPRVVLGTLLGKRGFVFAPATQALFDRLRELRQGRGQQRLQRDSAARTRQRRGPRAAETEYVLTIVDPSDGGRDSLQEEAHLLVARPQ